MKIVSGILALLVLAFFAYSGSEAKPLVTTKYKTNYFQAEKDSAKKASVHKENIGIGPVKEVKVNPLDPKLVKEGKNIFNSKCFACHKLNSKLVGPALIPIVAKTSPVYLMNYLLNTTEMQKKEPELKKLIKEYNGVVMPDQYLKENQAKAVLEYLLSNVKKK